MLLGKMRVCMDGVDSSIDIVMNYAWNLTLFSSYIYCRD